MNVVSDQERSGRAAGTFDVRFVPLMEVDLLGQVKVINSNGAVVGMHPVLGEHQGSRGVDELVDLQFKT